MPKLDNREIIKVDLPGFPKNDPAWVRMKKEASPKVFMDIEEMKLNNVNSGNTRVTFLLLSDLIQEWNLTDDHGDSAPINVESVGSLPMQSLVKLQEVIDFKKITGLSQAKKKP